jgi:hypothetical protein
VRLSIGRVLTIIIRTREVFSQTWWCMPVISATQKAEARRIMNSRPASNLDKVLETLSQKQNKNTRAGVWLKW